VIFRVIDTRTGEDVTDGYYEGYDPLADYALNEEWAKGLVYCDIEGFFIDPHGLLILADECGNFRYCPPGRFKVEKVRWWSKAFNWITCLWLMRKWRRKRDAKV